MPARWRSFERTAEHARGRARRALPCAALAALTALGAAPPAAAQWSAPASPPGCASARADAPPPLVVFPSAEPDAASGPGALLWSAPRGCGAPGARDTPGARDASATAAAGAALAADDRAGRGGPLSAAAGLATVTAVVGTAEGQVVAVGSGSGTTGGSVAGEAEGAVAGEAGGVARKAGGRAAASAAVAGAPAAGETGAFAEGPAPGTFAPAHPLGGPAAPVAVANAYLGDVVVVSPTWTPRTGWALAVRAQRHYSAALAPPRLVPVGGRPTAVAAALDYRAEALLVWTAHGAVYARELVQGGTHEPARRLGVLPPGTADPEVQALLSDDGHAIVAWRSYAPAPGGGALATLELSRFEVGAGAPAPPPPTVVERFRAPGPPPGALRLTRLSSEAVMAAWTGRAGDRYVVRASPVSLRRGAWAPVTISGASRTNAALADLVAGPHAEALAVWRATPSRPHAGGERAGGTRAGTAGEDVAAVLAARGHYAGRGEVSFEAPEALAPPGPHGPPAAAIDPRSGRAVAAWVTRPAGARAGRVVYVVRAPGPASAAPPAAPSATARYAHRAGASTLVLTGLAALCLLLAAVGWRAVHRLGRVHPGRG